MFTLRRVSAPRRRLDSALAITCGLALLGLSATVDAQPADPLPSWNDGPAKKAIPEFVARVTTEGGPEFVPAPQRIATFDSDGTLWSEQPIYFQLAFAMDRVKALASKHPEWKSKQPFNGILEGDMKAVAAAGEKGLAIPVELGRSRWRAHAP